MDITMGCEQSTTERDKHSLRDRQRQCEVAKGTRTVLRKLEMNDVRSISSAVVSLYSASWTGTAGGRMASWLIALQINNNCRSLVYSFVGTIVELVVYIAGHRGII